MEVNNVPQPSSQNSGMGFFLGIIVLVVFVLFVIFYGIPMMRSAVPTAQPSNPQTTQPQQPEGSGDTNIQIPDEIDVNLNNNTDQE